jgi:hypothetical protein
VNPAETSGADLPLATLGAMRLRAAFSDLNLNGATPPRVQPRLGEWGPELVPSTGQKRRMRIWVGLVLLGAMLAVFGLGWYVYHAMTGSWGFGIDHNTGYFAPNALSTFLHG